MTTWRGSGVSKTNTDKESAQYMTIKIGVNNLTGIATCQIKEFSCKYWIMLTKMLVDDCKNVTLVATFNLGNLFDGTCKT